MKDQFITIDPQKINDNVYSLIGDDWMLITAGNIKSHNTMTASWGFMGILWNKPIAVCFIRPQRYTLGFVESSDYFTLSFFSEEYRHILNYCGSRSGRDHDKVKETGLTPVSTKLGNVTFLQARLVFECRKLYADTIKENNFIVKELISRNYPGKDFHRFFFGEVKGVYRRKGD